MTFSIDDLFRKCDHIPQETADLVILTEEILNGILHFLCAVAFMQKQSQIINTIDRIA